MPKKERPAMTTAELLDLFAPKATEPLPESSRLLVRHLKCKESLKVAHSLVEAIDRFAARGRPISACTGRNTGAAGVATLAPAFTNALPMLDGMPFSYSHEFHAQLLYELCTALVREGLGGPETWRRCEGSAVMFAQRAIMETIDGERWNLLQRNVEYHVNVSDLAERNGQDVPLENGRPSVTVECGGRDF